MNQQPQHSSTVYITEGQYDHSLDSIVEEILSLFPANRKNSNILVKPNILGAHAPQKAVTTHPALVSAVIRKLKDCGARVMVGDNPGMGGYGRSQRAARECGLLECSGDSYINLGLNPVRIKVKSDYFSQITVSGEILDADELINLPKLKTHSLTVLTGAVKNTFGYIVGADKMRVHAACPTPLQFAHGLVDIYQIRPPELNIMDAIMAMEGNGPSNGKPVHLSQIMASENAVTLDCAAIHMLGHKPAAVPHLQVAAARELGQSDLKLMNITGKVPKVKGFRFPRTFVPGLAGIILNRYLSRWANCLPEVVSHRCTACGICAGHCPVKAMKMSSEGPRLDKKGCIHCYCCQEMCPENAIRLSGRFLRLLQKR
ncbi:DUF362 domain-containing protein [Desulfonatronovibrio magnus]|uniref:DUF362 domain-containing protein n=1 Tax=Desulfonatronovibrio magnus TaxID=698827 RepID=UPI0005EB5293|nr:DUF362 domain-containing protein [Desulfonatronovibrio magnus]